MSKNQNSAYQESAHEVKVHVHHAQNLRRSWSYLDLNSSSFPETMTWSYESIKDVENSLLWLDLPSKKCIGYSVPISLHQDTDKFQARLKIAIESYKLIYKRENTSCLTNQIQTT